MAKKKTSKAIIETARPGTPSAVVDTRVVYCGDNLEQLKRLPEECVDLIYIDPLFNSDFRFVG